MPSRRSRPGQNRKIVRLIGVVFLVVLILICVLRPASAAEAPVSKEYQIKAAFLYNFTKFVEWPAERFDRRDAPIVIGVLGRNSFGDELTAIVRGRKVGGRAITVARCDTVEEAAHTHVVFVAGDDTTRLEALHEAAPAGVLVVSEAKARGAMIEFITVGDKVRFEIDVAAAERAGLKISAQLQKLATVVHRKP